MTPGEQYTSCYTTTAYIKQSYVRSRFISRLGLTVTNKESHLYHLFNTIIIFTITTTTATVNEELFQKVPHEAQLPKRFSFSSVLLSCHTTNKLQFEAVCIEMDSWMPVLAVTLLWAVSVPFSWCTKSTFLAAFHPCSYSEVPTWRNEYQTQLWRRFHLFTSRNFRLPCFLLKVIP